jgi:hypothetical protein
LKEICAKGLQVSDENCFELLVLADMHGVRALKHAAIAHIKKNIRDLILSPQWKPRIRALPRLQKEVVEALLV